ncbi:9381_t:CDS:2 [Diversispora eburnea]|uniref:9381_t:CDS:1 n=1 Tax=Diversispora eburnea TaxID=1213867 RepID=A0A9N8UYK9_9GLOM|nr:9381_t:CDS:2 [Diversispora eburnea]
MATEVVDRVEIKTESVTSQPVVTSSTSPTTKRTSRNDKRRASNELSRQNTEETKRPRLDIKDAEVKKRGQRIFGVLLGTLTKFKNDIQNKTEAQECWTAQKKNLANFLRTNTEPSLYYLPARVSQPMVETIARQKRQLVLESTSSISRDENNNININIVKEEITDNAEDIEMSDQNDKKVTSSENIKMETDQPEIKNEKSLEENNNKDDQTQSSMTTEEKSPNLIQTNDTADTTDATDATSNSIKEIIHEEHTPNVGIDSLTTGLDTKDTKITSDFSHPMSTNSVNPIINQFLSNKIMKSIFGTSTEKNVCENVKTFFLSTPMLIFVIYLFIYLVWSYVQKSHLILIGIGCVLGNAFKIGLNSIQNNVVVVQESSLFRNNQNLFQGKSVKSDELEINELNITPRINESLNKVYSYIIRDIVDYYYDPINPNQDPELSTQVRNSMNAMTINLSEYLRNSDQIEVGKISCVAIAENFIVHLREFRQFIASNKSLDVYCKENKSSVFAQTTNRKLQASVLRSLSRLMFTRLFPSNESRSRILMAFISELWATQVFEKVLDTICDPDWINWTIVDYLTDDNNNPDEIHDTTLFQQLATSIDEEVAGLAERLKQPSTSSTQSNSLFNFKPEEINELNISIGSSSEIYSVPFSPNSLFSRSANSINLRIILDRQSEMFAEFMAFLEEYNADNLLRFWLQADSFRKIASNELNIKLIQEDALGIFKAYFGEAATCPVKVVEENIVKQCAREIAKAPTCNCFITMQEYVFGVLQNEYFDDFVKRMKEQGEDMSFMINDEIRKDEEIEHHSEDDNYNSLNNSINDSNLNKSASTFLENSENQVSHKMETLHEISENIVKENLVTETSENFISTTVEEENPRTENSIYTAVEGEGIESLVAMAMEENSIENFVENSDYVALDYAIVEHESDLESLFERPLMDLNGVRIKMNDVSESSPNKYIYSPKSLEYMIQVEQPGSTGWIMTRKFSDFETMHSALVKAFPKAEKVTMPRLMLKRNQEACKALERYLNILLSDATLCESEPLQKFMKIDGLETEKMAKPKSTKSTKSTKSKALSILSIPKSMSMVNLVGVVSGSISNDENKNQREQLPTQPSSVESSKKSSPNSKRSSNSSIQKKLSLEILPATSDETIKNSTLTNEDITRPSVESVISTSWESSRTVTPTIVPNECDTTPIGITTSIGITDTLVTERPTLEKLEMSYNLPPVPSFNASSSASGVTVIDQTPTPLKRHSRPQKQLTSDDTNLLIDLLFAIVEEIFDLSEKSQWHLRKTVLSVLRQVVRRSYTEAIKSSFLMTIDSFYTEDYCVSMIDNLTNSFWPNGEWSDVIQERTEEDKLKTKEDAKKLLLQKAVPDSLKQVMGYENSRLMVGRLVDDFLAEKEVVRGMGINILDRVLKLVIPE